MRHTCYFSDLTSYISTGLLDLDSTDRLQCLLILGIFLLYYVRACIFLVENFHCFSFLKEEVTSERIEAIL